SFPGLAILITVLALNLLAEGLTDAWAAPRSARGTAVRAEEADAAVPAEESTETGDALARLAAVAAGRPPRVPPLPAGSAPLLSVEDLTIRFPERYGDVPVVQNLSFDVRVGETLGLVGESGCGKSLTSLAIMGLLPRAAQVSGRIVYDGRDILHLPPRERRAISGPEIAMVYQDAMSSLNPSVLVGTQLRQLTKRGGTRTPEQLLELVGLDPRRTLRSYPHELSGG